MWLIVQFGSSQHDLSLKEKPLKIDEPINVLCKQIWIRAIGIGARAQY